jgi:hypothetical protein
MPKITKQGGPSFDPNEPQPDPGTFAESGGLAESALPAAAEGDTTERTAEGGGVERVEVDSLDEFDPAEYTVDEVNRYLDQCRDEENRAEFDRVIHAEQTGKNRVGILNRASGG